MPSKEAHFNPGHRARVEEDSLKRFFLLALAAHVAAAALAAGASFFLGMDLFPGEPAKDVQIIQSSVRVDVVAMPKLTVQELKKINPAQSAPSDPVEQTPKEAQAPSKTDVEFKTEKKVELSSLLSSLSSKRTEKAKKRKKKGPSVAAKELSSLVMEGNRVSKGQALVGDSLQAAQGEFAEYVAALPGHVRPHWKLPSYLMEKELRARIRVYISDNGKIVKTEIYESSGVKEFDRRALSALEKTGILPPPSKSIRSLLAGGQVVLGFPL